MIHLVSSLKQNSEFFNMSTGISAAVALSEGKFYKTFPTVSSETDWKENFLFILAFCFILSILGCLENLTKICWILSLLLPDSPIHSKRFSEYATDSKYVKVLAILRFSETILLFSINVILEPTCECLFEKYGLHVLQNGFCCFNV